MTAKRPELECDVIMKGGITSGVIYPHAITEFAKTYRFRGLGGASAGAIGAAFAAAAEHGRSSGGFEKLDAVPAQLGGGGLARLFQPERRTRGLFRILLAATGARGSLVPATIGAHPVIALLGAAPGVALTVVGITSGQPVGWILAACGILIALLGAATALVARVTRTLAHDVPANLFGICRGLSTPGAGPGFTDWLSERIDDIAGLPAGSGPLTFGALWGSAHSDPGVARRRIDLRMISTCLTQSRPFELPWEARNFFFDPIVWRTIFPGYIVDALEAVPPARPVDGTSADRARWEWQNDLADAHAPRLLRLPGAADLPVIVATRLSLSFPLLISAVPLWSIDFRSTRTQEAFRLQRTGETAAASEKGVDFVIQWFTDGGLTSNFPLHMFDSPIPTRPTFAINLGTFSPGQSVSPDEERNIEFADNNLDGLLPRYHAIPESGLGALTGFAAAAFGTARDWRDNSYLDVAGYRDRIVRVLQSPEEGGLNLDMDADAIARLGRRGRAAARALTQQFTEPRYGKATGWDNHRWVRFRALLAGMPEFLDAFRLGHAALDIDAKRPPSYPLTTAGRSLADRLAGALDDAAEAVDEAPRATRSALTRAPRPRGALRRVSRL